MADQEMTSAAGQPSTDPYAAQAEPPAQLPPVGGAEGGANSADDKRMSFLEHLSELRVRLRNAALAFIVAMIASFWFVQHYFDWLTGPVRRG